MRLRRTTTMLALGGAILSTVGGVGPAPIAHAATCREIRIWSPPPLGHHLVPTAESYDTECADCPTVYAEPGAAFSTVGGCNRI